ncbi:MAG TPA: FliA/WhiG family RNA polymerase sigma factor [Planctomycetes bacterium]|nr:FliA/WhiG family RNA polymerase sigma factor [Planctomycetota bacterium]
MPTKAENPVPIEAAAMHPASSKSLSFAEGQLVRGGESSMVSSAAPPSRTADKSALGTAPAELRVEALKDSRKHLNTIALRAYSGQKTQALRNDRIAEFLPMVRKIVHKVVVYMKPPLSFEDLVSAGAVGLVKAARDFDPSRNTEFKTYAYTKVKGAVLDELRGSSLLPANLNKQIRNAMQLAQKITEQTGAAPTDDQLAEELGITVDKLYETFESARARHFVSIDGSGEDTPALGDLLTAENTATPVQQVEQAELIDKLAEAIQQLPVRQRQIVLLYYQRHLTMKQIAEVFEITEPRVSQLHASALFNLSVELRQWNDGR